MSRPSPRMISLQQLLSEHTAPAAPELTRAEGDQAVRCLACGHRCKILPGRDGVCRIRFNRDGALRVPHGYVAGLAVDPIEKKPFYHAFPGRDALSFGMLGCDFHCAFCQNWVTSQTLRDANAIAEPNFTTAEQLVQLAVEHDCPVITSTYNEPLITSEWAVEIFKLGHAAGLVTAYVSNGHATPEVLDYLRPHLDLLKIDLKAFDDAAYRQLGGVLDNVLDTIRRGKQMGFWVEVVTLVVPGLNDSDDELRRMAEFLAGVSVDIPWHVTAFHPTYKHTAPPRTSVDTLLRAYTHGKAAGLRHVYPGNIAGGFGDRENTFCPACDATLITRRGFTVQQNRLDTGTCPDCHTPIPGVWG
jgi:pyruvate formate lyase activating enzyme